MRYFVAVLFVLVGTYAITRVVIWLMWRSEARKVEQRQTFDKIMQANQPPAAPGMHRKRVS